MSPQESITQELVHDPKKGKADKKSWSEPRHTVDKVKQASLLKRHAKWMHRFVAVTKVLTSLSPSFSTILYKIYCY